MVKKTATAAVAALALTAAAAAPSSAAPQRPDIDCLKAGIQTLRDAGLLGSVAREGLPIETAVSVGVTVREGADISGVPDPIPFYLVLADHRAGDDSLFVYPWCE